MSIICLFRDVFLPLPYTFTPTLFESVLTVVPSALLLIFLSPRIFKVLGKGRLEGVKAGPVFYFKMLTLIAALGVQAAILAKTVSMDNYHSSLILSTVMYLLALVRLNLPFHLPTSVSESMYTLTYKKPLLSFWWSM